MSVQLDHTIVPARDRRAAAELLAFLLGVPWAESGVGPFCPVFVNDGLTLDVDQADGPFPVQHYCFRVSEDELDGIVTLAFGGVAAPALFSLVVLVSAALRPDYSHLTRALAAQMAPFAEHAPPKA